MLFQNKVATRVIGQVQDCAHLVGDDVITQKVSLHPDLSEKLFLKNIFFAPQ